MEKQQKSLGSYRSCKAFGDELNTAMTFNICYKVYNHAMNSPNIEKSKNNFSVDHG